VALAVQHPGNAPRHALAAFLGLHSLLTRFFRCST
jgi:hypothetical protein